MLYVVICSNGLLYFGVIGSNMVEKYGSNVEAIRSNVICSNM